MVIYPAVPEIAPLPPWSSRENSLLCLGRISPEKQIERSITVLDQTRALGHAVRMHLVGGADDSGYLGHIRKLCEARQDSITFHGPLYGAEKQALLGRCRFGISACDREAFGIATAEMMKAGIVPFVPEAGAQSEIVLNDAVVYRDVNDATAKIDALLRSETRQEELHKAMLRRAEDFDPERFCTRVRDLVERALLETKRQAVSREGSLSHSARFPSR